MNRFGKCLKGAWMLSERLSRFFSKRDMPLVGVVTADVLKPRTAPFATALFNSPIKSMKPWQVIIDSYQISHLTTFLFQNLTSYLRRVPLFFLVGGFIFSAVAQNPIKVKNETAVANLKQYLSQAPCISRLVYSDFSSFVPKGKYVIAVNGNDYYCRQIQEGEDWNAPVSKTNRIRSGLFVGRWGLTRWQITGFDVAKGLSESLNEPNSDPHAVFSDQFRYSVDKVVNFGPSMVRPGTFTWSGDNFQAIAASIMTNGTGHPEFNTVKGTIKTENGRISEISCSPFGGTFRYEYQPSTNLPLGFPSTVYVRGRDGKWIKWFEYQEIVLAAPDIINQKVFTPEYHINPEVAIITTYSNKQVIAKPSISDDKIVQLVQLQNAIEKKAAPITNKKTIVIMTLSLIFILPALIIIYKLVRGRQA